MKVPAVEGLTPEILWYTLVGLVGIGGLIVLGDKVIEVFRKKHERKKLERQPTDEIADIISGKVLEKMEPRFKSIENKLANDKLMIEDHTRKLAAHEREIEDIDKEIADVDRGNKVLCRGILALLSHEINGNSKDKLAESQREITDYLIDK